MPDQRAVAKTSHDSDFLHAFLQKSDRECTVLDADSHELSGVTADVAELDTVLERRC